MIKDDKPLLKRFPAEESDGKRVIIAIGIGLAKMHHMQFHEWRPELAPTRILKNDFLSRKITFIQYQNGYEKPGYGKVTGFNELIDSRQKAQRLLKTRKKEYANSPTKHLTLLCYCLDKHICHRSLIKKKILEIDEKEEEAIKSVIL